MAFTVTEILKWTGGRLVNGAASGSAGNSFDTIRVDRPSPLAISKSSDIAFFFSKTYQDELPAAAPGVLITGEAFAQPLEQAGLPFWKKTAVIACQDPYFAMALLSEKFAANLSSVAHLERNRESYIHPSAVVAPSAVIETGAQIGANCVIEADVKVGAGTVLYPSCYLGPRVHVGRDCVFFAGVAVYEWTEIGDRVRLHAGCVIGSDGFGYAPKRDGKKVFGHQKIFHLGRVVIGDDVEIGANSCVDRSTFGDTLIGNSAKLDNLVHVGHNAKIDVGAVICGGTCLAGNASIGKFAYVGGLTGIANHVHVGDGASVGAVSLVTKDVEPGGTAVGNPQRDHREHFKAHARLSRLIAERRKKADEGSKGGHEK